MPEVERAILGAILLSGELPKGLDLRDFTHPHHKALWELLLEQVAAGLGVDLVSVLGKVGQSREQARFGGIAYVAGLPGACPSVEALPHWLKQLRQCRRDRESFVRIQEAAETAQAGDLRGAEELLKKGRLGGLPEAPAPELLPEAGKPEIAVLARLKALKKQPDRVKADEVLRWDSRWEARLWWDDFRKQKMLGERAYQDADDTRLSLWLSRVYRLNVAPTALGQIIGALCQDQSRDPLRDYLRGVRWDGVPRIGSWLQSYLGVESTPIKKWLGQAWLVQAVARALQPGCQADATLVLLGEQGEGKTGTFRDLVGPFWSESKIDIGNVPRCYQQIASAWVHELGEMAQFLGSRVDQNEAKNFLTAPTDDFIPLHGRNPVQWQRRCVFVGTTNRPEILRDPTGARRFWPVEVGAVGPVRRDQVARLRDQFWAEAVVSFDSGFQWWLPKERFSELREVQADYRASDSWEDRLLEWLGDPEVRRVKEPVTSRRLLVGAIGKKLEQVTRADEMRVGDLMAGLGWRHKAVWSASLKRTVNAFVPKDPQVALEWSLLKKEEEA
jgi:predicted P-loop ATPase